MSKDPLCPMCGSETDHASGYVYRRSNPSPIQPANQEPVVFRVCQNQDCRHGFRLEFVADRHPRLYQAEKEASP